MADITLKGKVTYGTEQPYKVELTRGQKGAYGWTITVHDVSAILALNELAYLDRELCAKYAAPAPEIPTE